MESCSLLFGLENRVTAGGAAILAAYIGLLVLSAAKMAIIAIAPLLVSIRNLGISPNWKGDAVAPPFRTVPCNQDLSSY